jgi:hypothetical protein
MTTEKKILKALSKLGITQEEVRQYLAFKGYKGKRCLSDRCPVANYLEDNGINILLINNNIVPNPTALDIYPKTTLLQRLFRTPEEKYSLAHDQYPFIKAVSEFIVAFDTGKYPELIEHDEQA